MADAQHVVELIEREPIHRQIADLNELQQSPDGTARDGKRRCSLSVCDLRTPRRRFEAPAQGREINGQVACRRVTAVHIFKQAFLQDAPEFRRRHRVVSSHWWDFFLTICWRWLNWATGQEMDCVRWPSHTAPDRVCRDPCVDRQAPLRAVQEPCSQPCRRANLPPWTTFPSLRLKRQCFPWRRAGGRVWPGQSRGS